MKKRILTIYIVLFVTALNAQTKIIYGNKATDVLISSFNLNRLIMKLNNKINIENDKETI